MYETKPYFYGTGRRKNSVARVRVYNGTGKVTINDRDIDDYFGLETLKLIVRQPLALTELEGKFDVVVRVSAGGVKMKNRTEGNESIDEKTGENGRMGIVN